MLRLWILTTMPSALNFNDPMAVPKKKTAKSRSKVRYNAYVKKQQKKLLNFIERAKRNEKGAAQVLERFPEKSSVNITKIEA